MKRSLCALLAVLAVALTSGDVAAAKGKKKKKGKREPVVALVAPLRLELSGFDLTSGHALVQVSGPARAPEARHFLFQSEPQRRFLPTVIDCQPQGGDKTATLGAGPVPVPRPGQWRCRLGIARVYQRHTLTGISYTVREQTVSADGEAVRSLWAEARSRAPLPVGSNPRPRDQSGPWAAPKGQPPAVPAVDEGEDEGE